MNETNLKKLNHLMYKNGNMIFAKNEEKKTRKPLYKLQEYSARIS